MNALLESFDMTQVGILGSTRWLRIANPACVAGALVALASIVQRVRAKERTPITAYLHVPLLLVALGASLASVWTRGVEVNHFPSQTMSEVLVMAGFFGLLAMLVLHFALGFKSLPARWRLLSDGLFALVFLGVFAIYFYSGTLSTAQRDLPPALQSYWFPPHLMSLIFSYMTLSIAGLIATVYFSVRFWSGVFSGGRSVGSQLLVFALLALVPFAQFVTIPVLLAVGLAFLFLRWRGALPARAGVASLERTMDAVSYRAFCVGIPFLTAGLFMGAFWAQDAWANYWGWDSKENSALITWLVYVVYIHLRMLGGYRGEKAMAVLVGGALSVFLTFQIFGYLPDSQKSLHRYTDDGVVPREGMQGKPSVEESARLEGNASPEAPK